MACNRSERCALTVRVDAIAAQGGSNIRHLPVASPHPTLASALLYLLHVKLSEDWMNETTRPSRHAHRRGICRASG
jgi:hypothetical protein